MFKNERKKKKLKEDVLNIFLSSGPVIFFMKYIYGLPHYSSSFELKVINTLPTEDIRNCVSGC